MVDVLIVGAGPAGAIAATVLARAGATVSLVDRASFPREKLCGDTINPGALATLRRLGVAQEIEHAGLRVDGMTVTGEHGIRVTARYPDGLHGVALSRAELDWALLQHAVAAGAMFDPGVAVRGAIVHDDGRGRPVVGGVLAGETRRQRPLDARVVIAADGRRSTVAFGLGLARHPVKPRRWAVGAYFDGGAHLTCGEMHIRRGRYIGVAPLPAGMVNICLVRPAGASAAEFRDPAALLRREIAREPLLADRFASSRMLRPPTVLGPLAVDGAGRPIDGLILAGDAAGFVDPMTGDGLRFAVQGGVLAAGAALQALAHGWDGVHADLAAARRREFAAKLMFNRVLRTLVTSGAALRTSGAASRLAPQLVRALIARAGDCNLAAS